MVEIVEIECRVTGRVQGVMYRDFTQRKARGLWVTGFVKNLPDRIVQVVAQGPEDKLNVLIGHLHKGSFASQVRNVSVEWRDAEKEYRDFVIDYGL